MWLLRNLLWLAIMVIVVGFAILNMRETVTAINLPGQVYHALPVNVAVFAAFAAGMFLAFVIAFFQVLQARSEVSAMERQKEDLLRELDQLRNLPLEGLRSGTQASGAR